MTNLTNYSQFVKILSFEVFFSNSCLHVRLIQFVKFTRQFFPNPQFVKIFHGQNFAPYGMCSVLFTYTDTVSGKLWLCVTLAMTSLSTCYVSKEKHYSQFSHHNVNSL